MARQNLPLRGSFAAAGARAKPPASNTLYNKINYISQKTNMALISHS
jgi:hypothetical protein